MSIGRLPLRKRIGLEIERRLQNDVIREHPLQQLFWESTLRCNLSCRHCGSDCHVSAVHPDMPLADFLGVLDRIAQRYNPNEVFVIISGGEPLMRPDLEQCGRAIYERGFPWGMVTNGLALTPRRFEALLQAGLHSMSVSLDGLEENHNWMRGNAQSFSKASQAIDLLVGEPSVAYDVITCVTEHNYEELPRLRDFLIAKGVRDWRLLTVVPMGRAAADAELGLTDAHFRGLMEFIKTTRREGSIRAEYGCEGYLGAYEFDVRDHAFVCSAGVTIGSVLIDGSISACTSIRSDYHQGNIYQDDFIDVWEHRFAAYRTDEWKRTGVCASCNAFRYCRGNGMHLRRGDGSLMVCHLKRLEAE